jgi:hypothetical protein
MSGAEVDEARKNGARFFILKLSLAYGSTEKPCSQECEMFSKADGGLTFRTNEDVFVHNCDTSGSNSGSPIFMRGLDGSYSLIALHGGADSVTEEDRKLGFVPHKHTNYATPIGAFEGQSALGIPLAHPTSEPKADDPLQRALPLPPAPPR